MAEIDAHEATLVQLNGRVAEYEADLQQNPLKRDAIRLYDQITQMEVKRDLIAAEMEVRLAPTHTHTPAGLNAHTMTVVAVSVVQ